MKNKLVADIFRHIAEILQIKEENVFRVRAYQKAADNIEAMPEDIAGFVSFGRLGDIPGIGADLSAKIAEIVSTGKLKFYEDLKESIPEGLLAILDIPSVGPHTAGLLYKKLKIKSIAELEKAVKAGKLKGIPGIKEKTIANIREGIDLLKRARERMPFAQAAGLAADLVQAIKDGSGGLKRIVPAGSLRRCRETVRDIDILVVSASPRKVMGVFTGLPQVKDVLAHGPAKSSVRTGDGVQVDCRVVEERSFGAALMYFTGSRNFNIHLRKLALSKGWKINEYGVFKGRKFLAGRTEEEIFKLFKMQYVDPEIREDAGEFESAQKFELPGLIRLEDIKGDLHAHSDYSDGENTIEEMARAAQSKGYSYIALTDHSQGLKIAGGLSLAALKKKRKEIDLVNRKLPGFRVFFGAEVDIDSEGRLDYPDDVLKQFDIVIGAVHLGFKYSRAQQTSRIVRACRSKLVHFIAHPTGRLWGSRDSYELDWPEVFKAAVDTNTALEINSFPDRLDLNDRNSRFAAKSGVKIAINTDSHAVRHLDNMHFGISVARRAGIGPGNVINTLLPGELLKAIKK